MKMSSCFAIAKQGVKERVEEGRASFVCLREGDEDRSREVENWLDTNREREG